MKFQLNHKVYDLPEEALARVRLRVVWNPIEAAAEIGMDAREFYSLGEWGMVKVFATVKGIAIECVPMEREPESPDAQGRLL